VSEGTPRAARDDFADELRGFALAGLAAANAPYLVPASAGFLDASAAAALDRAAAFAVTAFAQGKLYLLFSFLLGYSLSYVAADGTAARLRVLRRRLVGLGVIGLAHAWLVFAADILFVYAVLGAALLWLAPRSDRTLLVTAAAAFAAWLAVLALLPLVEGSAPIEAVGTAFARWDEIFAATTFAEATLVRLSLWPYVTAWTLLVYAFAVLGLFCVGLVAGRRKLLADPAMHRGFWRASLAVALLVGLPGALASAWLATEAGDSSMRAVAIGLASGPPLALGYAAFFAIVRTRRPDTLRVFRPAGRMSLTCYVGQSLILSLVFCGYGFGLFGRVGVAGVTAIALLAWLALALFACLWLRRHARGPLEWALRRWSHGRGVA
jgi:uncharacterized protein